MSVISGTVGAILGAGSAADANQTNRDNAAATNALNYRLFNESRGGTGNAFLPLYADQGTEKMLFDRAIANYQATLGSQTPEQQLARYQSIIGQLQPAVDAGNRTINDIYNGNLEQTQLAQAQPVFDARGNIVALTRQGIAQGLQQALSLQQADEARKGYSGTGSFARNRSLQSIVGANEGAAQAQGQATLANALDTQAIQHQNQNLRIQSLDSPINRAQQLIQMSQAPQTAVNQQYNNALSGLNFFKLGTQAFQNQNMPQVSAVPGAAQLALQGVSQTGGQVLNAYLNSKGTLFGGQGWGAGAAAVGGDYGGGAAAIPGSYPS